jgi:hypothetical protein
MAYAINPLISSQTHLTKILEPHPNTALERSRRAAAALVGIKRENRIAIQHHVAIGQHIVNPRLDRKARLVAHGGVARHRNRRPEAHIGIRLPIERDIVGNSRHDGDTGTSKNL